LYAPEQAASILSTLMPPSVKKLEDIASVLLRGGTSHLDM
jgi:hypothetical protein